MSFVIKIDMPGGKRKGEKPSGGAVKKGGGKGQQSGVLSPSVGDQRSISSVGVGGRGLSQC